MNTKRIIRAFGVALLMLLVLVSTSSVAHADKRSRKRKDNRRHSSRRYNRSHSSRRHSRRSYRRHRSSSRLWLNFDRNIVRNNRYNYYWIPGRYETHTQEVLVESAHYETIHIPAKTVTYYDRERRRQAIVIKPSRKEKVWVPARYETRSVTVWVPGYYTPTVTRRRFNSGTQFSFRF